MSGRSNDDQLRLFGSFDGPGTPVHGDGAPADAGGAPSGVGDRPHGCTGAPAPSSPLPIFDLSGELPRGRWAIEASAGTGKTFTLAGLTVRYLAEGIAPSAILIVTFTRAATAELRGRIREFLREAISFLEAVQRGEAVEPSAAHLPALAQGDVDRRLRHLRDALAAYDSISITTIHSFATQTLKSLGATASLEVPKGFAENEPEALGRIAADVLVRAAESGVEPGLLPNLDDLTRAIGSALATPEVVVLPDDDEETDDPCLVFARLVREALALVAARRRVTGEMTFDDVLTGVRDLIAGEGDDTQVGALRARYRVAMIDEFQDTDPVQWAIFDAVFAGPEHTLIVVGDPKQSIYSFRGADIDTYLEATQRPDTVRTALGVNWRSDGRILTAIEALIGDVTFGGDIGFIPVKAAPDNEHRHALDGGEPVVPVELRVALGDDLDRTGKRKTRIEAGKARNAIFNDVAHRVRRILEDMRLPTDDGGFRDVKASDIAVLVFTAREAREVQSRLTDAGIPSVLARSGHVFDAPAADAWRSLLDALVRPADPKRARRFALSWFGNVDPASLDAADDETLSGLFEQLRGWRETLRDRGVGEFVRRVLDDSNVLATVLRWPDGDRAATDLLHVAELLQSEPTEPRPSPSMLLELLGTSKLDERDENDIDERERRVETQDAAVQIMTVHVSKGLEFPIVLAPTLFTASLERGPAIGRSGDGRRIVHVAGKKAPEDVVVDWRKRQNAERMRLLYVALTRARHHLVLWWGTCNYADRGPLTRVLFGRDGERLLDDVLIREKVDIPDDSSGFKLLDHFVERSGGLIRTELMGKVRRLHGRFDRSGGTGTGGGDADDADGTDAPTELRPAELAREPDRRSARWSFSAIASQEALAGRADYDPDDDSLGDAGAADEPDDGVDPAEAGGTGDGSGGTDGGYVLPMAALPAGAQFGTLVHAVFEHVDFTAEDLDAEIRAAIDEELSWRHVDLTPRGRPDATHDDGVDLLVAAVRGALETPLGPLFDGGRLRDIGRGDRLDELDFELLLREGGDPSVPALSDRELGEVIARHLPATDPLAAWARGVAAGRFDVDLTGHLTGSIDAVFRVRRDGADRYVVCDYKTNRLEPPDRPATPDDYGRAAMTEAMAHHHYPLQALLYSVALHRYLRSRLRDYDPELHLGGIAYLFVRGMAGAGTPVRDGTTSGVWTWRPPAALVIDLSDVLDRVVEPTTPTAPLEVAS